MADLERTTSAEALARRQARLERRLAIGTTPVLVLGFGIALVLPRRLCEDRTFSSTSKAEAELSVLRACLEKHAILDEGRYPESLGGLAPLLQEGFVPLSDPWGTPYHYVPPTAGAPLVLLSFGADGEPGGTGDDADLFPR